MENLIKRFDTPDECRSFDKGKFELVNIGGMTLGRASYEPGWRWLEHVGKLTGQQSCLVSHLGMVVSGRAMVRMDDGEEFEIKAGDVFAVAPGHDSWVIGNEPYVSLHVLGAEEYAQ